MAFFNFEREQTNIKVKGQAVTVPNNCFAKLMYYLDSVSSCVPGLDIPSEYKNYDSYNNLNDDDKRTIIALAALLSPDLLEGKVFFLVDDNHRLLLGSRNKFYELTIAKQYLGGLVAGQGVICVNGQKKQVIVHNTKILFTMYKTCICSQLK